ncbi:MAG: hypothetical protein M3P39_07395 [Actinomycetota bacterium]|nr:hypothetical protein [Actinomycetota bacterium]
MLRSLSPAVLAALALAAGYGDDQVVAEVDLRRRGGRRRERGRRGGTAV